MVYQLLYMLYNLSNGVLNIKLLMIKSVLLYVKITIVHYIWLYMFIYSICGISYLFFPVSTWKKKWVIFWEGNSKILWSSGYWCIYSREKGNPCQGVRKVKVSTQTLVNSDLKNGMWCHFIKSILILWFLCYLDFNVTISIEKVCIARIHMTIWSDVIYMYVAWIGRVTPWYKYYSWNKQLSGQRKQWRIHTFS